MYSQSIYLGDSQVLMPNMDAASQLNTNLIRIPVQLSQESAAKKGKGKAFSFTQTQSPQGLRYRNASEENSAQKQQPRQSNHGRSQSQTLDH